jgi:hypothetical protein
MKERYYDLYMQTADTWVSKKIKTGKLLERKVKGLGTHIRLSKIDKS